MHRCRPTIHMRFFHTRNNIIHQDYFLVKRYNSVVCGFVRIFEHVCGCCAHVLFIIFSAESSGGG